MKERKLLHGFLRIKGTDYTEIPATCGSVGALAVSVVSAKIKASRGGTIEAKGVFV